MPSLILLIPVALILVLIAITIYIWAVNSGQYRDLDREATRILFGESKPTPLKKHDDGRS